MVSRFTTADGLSLAFADEGPRDALPVLCLAGLTRNMDDFADLAARLSPTRRVILLDFRGGGASDHAPDPMTYDVPHEAADALALLDHLALDSAVFLGTSRGGLLTMFVAATAPRRIRAAILNDIGPEIAPGGLARISAYVGRPAEAATLDALAERLQAEGRAGAPTLTAAECRRIAGNVAEDAPGGVRFRYDLRLGELLARQAEAAGGLAPDLWPLFRALEGRPVLALRGANSDLLAPETVERMRKALPRDFIAVEVPDRAHVPLLDEPEAVAAIDALLLRAEGAA